MEIRTKLASRKLWIAIGGVLTILLVDWAKLSPDFAEWIIAAVSGIAIAYLGGQGLTDAMKELAAGKAPDKKAKK